MQNSKKDSLKNHFNRIAQDRDSWIERNQEYYRDLLSFYSFHIPEGSKVLEIGSGSGYLLASLRPSMGVGIDVSENMIAIAQQKYSHLKFMQMDAEKLKLSESFQYIVISDTLGYMYDVQRVLNELKKVSNSETRIIINFQNFLWQPFLQLAESLNLKMPATKLNWLDIPDIENLLDISGYEVIKKGRRLLFPISIPLLSEFLNRFIAHMPLINKLCLTQYVIFRKKTEQIGAPPSVSIIIPARNEQGNIQAALERIPHFSQQMEIIFIEGHSKDETWKEIKKQQKAFADKWHISSFQQKGIGKADAVRLGFEKAKNDVLMILDADLTVRPEDLPKFFSAIADNSGEYIQGSRLVYPMEKEAMRFLNMLGNTFFSWAFSWLLGQRIKDTLCGTKVISKDNWNKIVANRSYFGDFDPFGDFDLLFGADKLDLKIREIPIRYQAREYGETNISRFKHGLLLLRMVVFAAFKVKFI